MKPSPYPADLKRLCDRLSEHLVALPLRLKVGENARLFSLSPLPERALCLEKNAPWPKTRANDLNLSLEVDGTTWVLHLRGMAARELSAPPKELEGPAWEELPFELRLAFLALTLDPLLEQASAALGRIFRLRLSEKPDTWEEESILLPFNLTDASTGKSAGSGEARLPRILAAQSLLEDMASAFPKKRADVSTLPINLSLCAGHEAFPLGLLRQVEAGDMLLFNLPPTPSLTLEVNGHALWTATLADGSITLTGNLRLETQEIGMNPKNRISTTSTSGAKNGGFGAETLDTLEIVLTLEISEQLISVGELSALAPGYTLQTQASLDAPVTIKANGKALGTGRLAAVGDRLGVIIASLDFPGKG